jgi:acetylornithine deacetylase/succinyl-diaminopimelate desuccinylase-like protein
MSTIAESNPLSSNATTMINTDTDVALPCYDPATSPHLTSEDQAASLADLQAYIGFETVSATAPHTGAYRACAAWLIEQWQGILSATSSSSTTTTTNTPQPDANRSSDSVFYLPEAPDHSPVVIVHVRGRDASLPVLVLNSHYDVVPANASDWTYEPFGGSIHDNRLYGRGTQDMKCVGMQYMHAMKYLLRQPENGGLWRPQRDIYVIYVPDEGKLVQSRSHEL